VSATTTYKVQAATTSTNGGTAMKAAAPDNASGNNATSIRAIRVG
jgi:hypothetical protein